MKRSRFDRLGEATADVASRSAFFVGCVMLVVVWGFSFALIQSLNTWQLIINTITTIITFLLVALLQNSQRRSERALHAKLNAIADGLADLMEHEASGKGGDLPADTEDLRKAAGLEERV